MLKKKTLIDRINTLWQEVEWDWFTQGGQEVLYWHWSPEYNWEMNHAIRGHNETLITYVLAASSPNACHRFPGLPQGLRQRRGDRKWD